MTAPMKSKRKLNTDSEEKAPVYFVDGLVYLLFLIPFFFPLLSVNNVASSVPFFFFFLNRQPLLFVIILVIQSLL